MRSGLIAGGIVLLVFAGIFFYMVSSGSGNVLFTIPGDGGGTPIRDYHIASLICLILGISLVIGGAVGKTYEQKKWEMPQYKGEARACPKCGGPTHLVSKFQGWYCERCKFHHQPPQE